MTAFDLATRCDYMGEKKKKSSAIFLLSHVDISEQERLRNERLEGPRSLYSSEKKIQKIL